jgi:hypothetical protein
VVVHLEKDALQSDWFGVPTIESRTSEEHFVKGFTSELNNPHLVEASSAR